MPDRYELQSLANYARDAANNPIAYAFPVMDSSFWSSTSLTDTIGVYGGLQLDYGGMMETLGGEKTALYQVLCVRGTPLPRPSPRFVRDAAWESVIHDRHAGFVWQGCRAGEHGELCDTGSPAQYTWGEALSYCEDLDWASREDWRLPNAAELGGFSWYEQPEVAPGLDAAWDQVHYTLDDVTWTSTTFAPNPAHAWYSNGLRVHRDYGLKDGTGYAQFVRCVADAP